MKILNPNLFPSSYDYKIINYLLNILKLPTDLPDVTGYHRPPMRGHPTREGTLKKDRKKIESRKIENRKCPGKLSQLNIF